MERRNRGGHVHIYCETISRALGAYSVARRGRVQLIRRAAAWEDIPWTELARR